MNSQEDVQFARESVSMPESKNTRESVLEMVRAERARQEEKYGANLHYGHAGWYLVASEELGEIADSLLDGSNIENLLDNAMWYLVVKKKFGHIAKTLMRTGTVPGIVSHARPESTENMKEEIVQVAAVLVAWLESIEGAKSDTSHLEGEFREFVLQAQHETFTDGMNSRFADRIQDSIRDHGIDAVSAWKKVIGETDNVYETCEEFLRQIGRADDDVSHKARMLVLLDHLEHANPRIQDAALIGLSSLDDASALPMLRKMYARETATWMMHNIRQVIEQFEQGGLPDS